MFIKAGAEFQDIDHPIHVQAGEHKRLLLEYYTDLARKAGASDPQKLGCQLLLLKEGAIVTAVLLSSCDPATDAKQAARVLIDAALS